LQVSSALSNCTHVFIRHNVVKKPLQPPYDGLFQVISRTDKKEVVSIDHLKPAFLDSSSLPQPDVSITPVSAQSPTTVSNCDKTITCSGRPKHLS